MHETLISLEAGGLTLVLVLSNSIYKGSVTHRLRADWSTLILCIHNIP